MQQKKWWSLRRENLRTAKRERERVELKVLCPGVDGLRGALRRSCAFVHRQELLRRRATDFAHRSSLTRLHGSVGNIQHVCELLTLKWRREEAQLAAPSLAAKPARSSGSYQNNLHWPRLWCGPSRNSAVFSLLFIASSYFPTPLFPPLV